MMLEDKYRASALTGLTIKPMYPSKKTFLTSIDLTAATRMMQQKV